ncbi:MAG: hypothetical protein LBR80_17785 [Deltaproteobacteria bacterium]|nr:hypothetical protein [Deltaproteobacteria bacterium]
MPTSRPDVVNPRNRLKVFHPRRMGRHRERPRRHDRPCLQSVFVKTSHITHPDQDVGGQLNPVYGILTPLPRVTELVLESRKGLQPPFVRSDLDVIREKRQALDQRPKTVNLKACLGLTRMPNNIGRTHGSDYALQAFGLRIDEKEAKRSRYRGLTHRPPVSSSIASMDHRHESLVGIISMDISS